MKIAVIYNKKQIDSSDVINIFGPQTKELYNPKTVERVTKSLEKGGHNVKVVEGNINVAEELQHFMPRVMAGERPGMVFNMAYGIQGQSRYTHIPAMLEMLGVPYVGSGPQAHAVALDKVMSKIVFQQNHLPTPQFWFFSSPNDNAEEVTYPVIVKPKMEAVSMGLKVVDNEDDLRDAVQFIIETYQQQALVEVFVAGREFAVGLLGNGQDLEVLPVVEFDMGGDPNGIQTQIAKLNQPVEKICPANVPDELTQEMKRLARAVFHALGIHDFARIDLRMDTEGNLYILEVNSMASLGLTGSYVHSAKVAGYTFDSMVNRMLDVAAVRYFGADYLQAPGSDDKHAKGTQPLRVRLRSYLRSNLTTMGDHLRRMVEMNSSVYNTEGVNTLGNWLSNRLARLGFQREVFPQVEVGNILYFSNQDSAENDILLLSHLDTFYGFQDFVHFREERGRFYGSGVAESKGGLAIMLMALQALRYARRLRKVSCGILLTTDDTLGGRFSKKLVQDISRQSKYVVGLKYGDADSGIVTSCSGRENFQIEMSNLKDGKASNIPDVILSICKKVRDWQKLSSPEEGIVVKATSLEARTLYGPAPDYASLSLFTEFKDNVQGENLEREIRRIAKKNLDPRLQVRVKKGVHRPSVSENDSIRQFFEQVKKFANRLEVKVKPVRRSSSSDICYVPDGIPVLDGLGPVGGGARSPYEYILRDTLIDRATLLAMVIRESAKDA